MRIIFEDVKRETKILEYDVIQIQSVNNNGFDLKKRIKCWLLDFADGHMEYLPQSEYKIDRVEM